MNSIEVKSLGKTYKRYKKTKGFLMNFFNRKYEIKCALSDFDLSIKEGEILGILGQNGAGKTTIIKLLSGILYPTTGEISVLGYDPLKKEKEFKKKITLVLGQKAQMWWDVSAMDSFLLNQAIYEIDDQDFNEILNEMTSLLEVENLIHVPVRTLSLGERMKCELICALLHKPKIVYLDEPTIGLDVVVQENIRNFILNYRKKYNATIVLTSHYMKDIEKLCDRVIFIDNGKKYFEGTLGEFIKSYGNIMVLNIELRNKSEFDWSDFGEVASMEENKVKILVDKKDIYLLKNKISLFEEVQSVQIDDLEASEIVRNHFEKRKNYER